MTVSHVMSSRRSSTRSMTGGHPHYRDLYHAIHYYDLPGPNTTLYLLYVMLQSLLSWP